jgi:hypothetical protein
MIDEGSFMTQIHLAKRFKESKKKALTGKMVT